MLEFLISKAIEFYRKQVKISTQYFKDFKHDFKIFAGGSEEVLTNLKKKHRRMKEIQKRSVIGLVIK